MSVDGVQPSSQRPCALEAAVTRREWLRAEVVREFAPFLPPDAGWDEQCRRYAAQLARYRESYHSVPCEDLEGGLWDFGATAGRERYDARAAAATLAVGASPRELDVYTAFWVDGLSYQVVAAKLGIARGTVRSIVSGIRRRATTGGRR